MLNSQPIINKDDRRILYDWVQGSFKSAKAVEILYDGAIVGDHFHRHKDEVFFLLKGEFISIEVGALILFNVTAPHKVLVPRLTYHKFICAKDSILLGVATEEFDMKDEVKIPKP